MNIGRNDPCPCGSGKKYKKCCLEKDEKLVSESVVQRVVSEPVEPDGLEWEEEDIPAYATYSEDEEVFEEECSEENTEEDRLYDEPDDEDANVDDDEPDDEDELPEISEEENKLVDDWWEKYRKMDDTALEREHLVSFIDKYPHLTEHLRLEHEVLFELGADHFKQGKYEIFVALLLRIRKDFPKVYRKSYEYYDADMLFWATAQGRFEDLSEFFRLFKEDKKIREHEKFYDVFDFYRATDRSDILLAEFPDMEHNDIMLPIILNNIVSRYIEQPVTDESVTEMVTEMASKDSSIRVSGATVKIWHEQMLDFLRPFTFWDENIPAKRTEAIDYYFQICDNFAFFLRQKTGISMDCAIMYADMLYDYYHKIVINKKKRPVDIFCLNEKDIEKHSYLTTLAIGWFLNFKSFFQLNALYYFITYLKTCGNISDDRQRELHNMITGIYNKYYDSAKNNGPEMLCFKQFPLWNIY